MNLIICSFRLISSLTLMMWTKATSGAIVLGMVDSSSSELSTEPSPMQHMEID